MDTDTKYLYLMGLTKESVKYRRFENIDDEYIFYQTSADECITKVSDALMVNRESLFNSLTNPLTYRNLAFLSLAPHYFLSSALELLNTLSPLTREEQIVALNNLDSFLLRDKIYIPDLLSWWAIRTKVYYPTDADNDIIGVRDTVVSNIDDTKILLDSLDFAKNKDLLYRVVRLIYMDNGKYDAALKTTSHIKYEDDIKILYELEISSFGNINTHSYEENKKAIIPLVKSILTALRKKNYLTAKAWTKFLNNVMILGRTNAEMFILLRKHDIFPPQHDQHYLDVATKKRSTDIIQYLIFQGVQVKKAYLEKLSPPRKGLLLEALKKRYPKTKTRKLLSIDVPRSRDVVPIVKTTKKVHFL